ncbi:MAG: T9SS type A sorting domain-containing protein, partial [Ferruginibacter sp.]
MKKTYLILLLFVSSFAFAQAPLLIEDFSYTAGEDITTYGWASHSGSTNPILVTTPGLAFTGYVGSDVGLAAGVNNTGYDVNKTYTEQTTGSIYTSFLVNASTNTGKGGYFYHFFDPNANTAFRARTFIKPLTGKMLIGFSFNASACQDSSLSTLLNFGETYLFVVKYSIVGGAENDNVSLYIFKAGDDFTTEPATPFLGPLTATRTTPTDPLSALGPDIRPMGIALRQFEAAQKITVDGFRVKTNWDLKTDATVGITDNAKQQIGIYPNPVTDGYLNIKASASSEKQVDVYDLLGKKILSQKIFSNSIDVKKLKSGA